MSTKEVSTIHWYNHSFLFHLYYLNHETTKCVWIINLIILGRIYIWCYLRFLFFGDVGEELYTSFINNSFFLSKRIKKSAVFRIKLIKWL